MKILIAVDLDLEDNEMLGEAAEAICQSLQTIPIVKEVVWTAELDETAILLAINNTRNQKVN